MLLSRRVNHADLFRPHGAAHDRRAASGQRRFVDVEFVRVHRALHHHLAQTPRRGDKHHLVKAGFGIDGEHDAGGGQIGADHPLHPGGERHAAVIVTLMHAVGDCAIVKQRSKHVLHGNEHGVKALHVEECLLLPGEGGVRHIFRGGGRAHGE